MMLISGYLFQYGPFFLALMMLGWGVLVLGNRPIIKTLPFKLFPVLFLIIVFGQSYVHLTITSPMDHTVIHAGDKVVLKVALEPAFLTQLFPHGGLTLYRCSNCPEPPPGVTTEAISTELPYSFILSLPKTQSMGEMFVNAYVSINDAGKPAIRSQTIGLVVK